MAISVDGMPQNVWVQPLLEDPTTMYYCALISQKAYTYFQLLRKKKKKNRYRHCHCLLVCCRLNWNFREIFQKKEKKKKPAKLSSKKSFPLATQELGGFISAAKCLTTSLILKLFPKKRGVGKKCKFASLS